MKEINLSKDSMKVRVELIVDDNELLTKLLTAIGHKEDVLDHLRIGIKTLEAKTGQIDQSVNCYIFEVNDRFKPWKYIDLIRSEFPKTDIICISKEKDFDDVYMGFSHRISNYLIEPFEIDDLSRTLDEVLGRQQAIKAIFSNLDRLSLYELEKQQELMKNIMTNILEKPEELALMSGEVRDRYNINIAGDRYIGGIIAWPDESLYIENSKVRSHLLVELRDELDSCGEVIISKDKKYGLTIVINMKSESDVNRLNKVLLKIVERRNKSNGWKLDHGVTYGLGSLVHSLSEIDQSLEEALLDMRRSVDGFPSDGDDHNKPDISLHTRKALKKSVWSYKIEDIEAWFKTYYQQLDCEKWTSEVFLDFVGWLEDLFLEVFTEKGIDNDWEEYYEGISIRSITQQVKGLELLEKRLKSFCFRMAKIKPHEENETVSMIIEYMEEHFADSISLELLSQKFDWSSSYLSTKFKEVVGESYLEQLTDIRMEEAVKRLRNSDMTVTDIAQEVGYFDDKHFIRLFKKQYGMTPGVYRNIKASRDY